jgi:hypothetical protein
MILPRLTDLTDLAEFLKTLPANDDPDAEIGFDMRRSDPEGGMHPCGSACCIGGWIWLCNPETYPLSLAGAVTTLAPVKTLEAFKLCYPYETPDAWEATPQQAARAVEILRDEGIADWKRAMEEVQ